MLVIKIGGHLLFEKGRLRRNYIRSLLGALKKLSREDDPIVVVGGGQAAREYVTAGRELGVNESLLDMLGIQASRVNAALLHTAYHGSPPAIPTTIEEAGRLSRLYKPLFVGGLQPAQSTTTVAALLAEAFNAPLYIATNVEGIFTDDPRRNPEAKLLKQVHISRLKEMFSSPSAAGGYALLDPLTIAVLERSKIPTRVFSGEPPENILRAVTRGDIGTLVTYR